MSFLAPFFLWLIVPLVLFALLRYRQIQTNPFVLHSKILLQNRRSLWVRLAPFGALFWMLVALARPVLPEPDTYEAPQGETIFLAIDASRSMMAQDRKPNRYEYAKRVIEALLAQDTIHRFALIAFTSNPLILSPPTKDVALIEAALGAFKPDYILTHGTSITNLLAYIAKFSGETKKVVILSDGGDEEVSEDMIRYVKEGHMRIFAIACATKEGATIPTPNGPLKDARGHIVISMQNPALERLALESGAFLIDKSDPKDSAKALEKALSDQSLHSIAQEVRFQELFWLPLTLGILFFLFATLGWSKIRRPLGRFLPLVVSLFVLRAEAGLLDLWYLHQGYEAYEKEAYQRALELFKKIDPPLFESRYAEAATLYRLGAYKKAGRIFSTLKSNDPDKKRLVWYNLANCAAKMGHYKSALDYYVKALALGFDEEAWHNLQRLLFLKEKRTHTPDLHADKKVEATSKSGQSQTKAQKGSKNRASQGRQGGGANSAGSGGLSKRVVRTKASLQMPLSSKVYEMINKGYVHEKRPW